MGFGANDKTGDSGGSTWLNILDPHGHALAHWDINFDLAQIPGTPVPAPAGLLLFGFGLAAYLTPDAPLAAGTQQKRAAPANGAALFCCSGNSSEDAEEQCGADGDSCQCCENV